MSCRAVGSAPCSHWRNRYRIGHPFARTVCPSLSTPPATRFRPWPSFWPRRRCSGRAHCWGWTNPRLRPHRCPRPTRARRRPHQPRPAPPLGLCPHLPTRPAFQPRRASSWARVLTHGAK